jgi:hypothetical protein
MKGGHFCDWMEALTEYLKISVPTMTREMANIRIEN